MDIALLSCAVKEIKDELEASIRTAVFDGKHYPSGHQAKEALIRSQRLILKLHEVVKESLNEELSRTQRAYDIHPPIGVSSPEVKLFGEIKAKQQDIVVLFNNMRPRREVIDIGPLKGNYDAVGKGTSERSIVIGVRSQLSSIAKNFDTLMERSFAETLNLRLRLPALVMGEVYLLPIVEYDNVAMTRNQISFKDKCVPVEKFIKTFVGISGRKAEDKQELYKYERTALILVDFRTSPPTLCLRSADLQQMANIDREVADAYEELSPRNFVSDIVAIHAQRHPPISISSTA